MVQRLWKNTYENNGTNQVLRIVLNEDNDKAKSGLSWGFEIESLVLGILGDALEIEKKVVMDLLMKAPELQPLLAEFAESVQHQPEIVKEYGWKCDSYPRTIREELESLLSDVTDGNWHCVYGHGAHRKLTQWVIHNGDTEYITIRRVEDESSAIKKS